MKGETPEIATPVRLYAEIGSTNAEAMRVAAGGERGPIWLRAERQTAGKGRSGRAWTSEPGNLYATYLRTFTCPAPIVAQLSLVAGVAVWQSIAAAGGASIAVGLRLKWPNDVMLRGAKTAGILLEATSISGREETSVAIGIGVNVAHHPTDSAKPATSMAANGVDITPDAMLAALDGALRVELEIWNGGNEFGEIRRRWLERGLRLGEQITVNAGGVQRGGFFSGLGDDGALILRDDQGYEHRLSFGDVDVLPAA